MDLSLNPELDAKALRVNYALKNRGQVTGIFPLEQAERTYRCLASETPWGLFYWGDGEGKKIPAKEYKALSPEELQEIYKYIFETARDRYQFMYLFNKLNLPNPDPQLFIHEIANFMSSEPVLEFIRTLTAIPELIRADAQATRYIGNCFLHPHTDEDDKSGRRVAFVLNMTKNWDPNWGGFLQFFDKQMNITQSFKPTFNALNLFTVPQGHSVSFVAPFCPGERLSITGWFRDK